MDRKDTELVTVGVYYPDLSCSDIPIGINAIVISLRPFYAYTSCFFVSTKYAINYKRRNYTEMLINAREKYRTLNFFSLLDFFDNPVLIVCQLIKLYSDSFPVPPHYFSRDFDEWIFLVRGRQPQYNILFQGK